jgi:hypothetical protein
VVAAVGSVGIQKNIGIPFGKYFAETAGIFRVAFGKITIQVVVGVVAPETGFVRCGLSRAVIGAAVQVSTNIVNRNDDYTVFSRSFAIPSLFRRISSANHRLASIPSGSPACIPLLMSKTDFPCSFIFSGLNSVRC